MAFDVETLEIPGLMILRPTIWNDDRGLFHEIYKRSDMETLSIPQPFIQANFSISRKGVIRGLHYQKKPCAQGKLLWVVQGTIFDVAVDIRRGSPFFGKWHGIRLSESDRCLFWVPEGFAHGFMSLSDNSNVFYANTAEYSPDHERGICWNDPDIAIEWPLPDAVLNARDASFPLLRDADNNFEYDGEIHSE